MKTLSITLKKNELCYDIDFITYKVAKVHFHPTQPDTAMEVATSPSDHDFVDRLLESAVEQVKERLRFCLDETPYNAVSDRILPDLCTAPPDGNPAPAPLLPPPSAGCGSRGAYDLVLRTDDSWKGSLKVLCSAVHNFVVHHVVYHYLQLTAPTFAPAFGEEAEETLDRIGNYMRINHPIKNHLLWT